MALCFRVSKVQEGGKGTVLVLSPPGGEGGVFYFMAMRKERYGSLRELTQNITLKALSLRTLPLCFPDALPE